jgi:hypothetical protein
LLPSVALYRMDEQRAPLATARLFLWAMHNRRDAEMAN